jgi:SNF2 family DNA or RNA helicase
MKAEDYLEMPDIITAGMDIALTDEEMKAYREFEREQLMEVDDTEIEAVTAAALANKLLQFSGGAIYDGEHNWHEVGTSKVEALTELVEAAGEPVLVFYAYQHELARLTDALAEYDPVLFRGEPDILERWNRGEIRVLLCHPASVSFGLNMQQGGHIIVWYTPTWNLEQYLQANARLHRQGQQRPVILYHLVAVGTLDERVMSALSGKSTCQEFIMQRIKELKQSKQ